MSLPGKSNCRRTLTYLRYNVVFEPAWIARNLDTVIDEKLLTGLKPMDDPKNLEELYKVGSVAADKQVKDDHFPELFDVR